MMRALLAAALLLSAGCCPLVHPQWAAPFYVPADGLSLAESPCYVVHTSKSRVDVRRDRFAKCPPFASMLERARQAEEISAGSVSGSLVIVKATSIRCGEVQARGCTVPDPTGRMHRMTVLDGPNVLDTSRHEMIHTGLFSRAAAEIEHHDLDHRPRATADGWRFD